MELPARDIPLLCVDDDPARAEAAARQLLTHGMEQVAWLACPLADEPDGHADVSPAARLWSPSPFLERVLPSLPPGRALDLASGTGRAAVFLASLGHEVEAWDVDASALERAEAFAGRHGVHVRTRAIENQCFVIAPDQCGTPAAGPAWHGHSLIVDPWGVVLAEAGTEVGHIVADLDLERLAEVRRRLPALDHVRPEVFG